MVHTPILQRPLPFEQADLIGPIGTLSDPPRLTDRLVMAGDFPDPTVVRFGDYFYMTATTAEWAPVFPLYRSHDLITWEPSGSIFPKPPVWAEGNFWAPELIVDRGRLICCYTARARGGVLSVALASTTDIDVPFTDHGPLVAQAQGSIDGLVVRDENERLYLVWKEDGNAFKNATPIWAQPLREDLLDVEGEMVEIMRNDTKWEGCLVEGSAIERHGDYFYMFFAGNGCCGKCCTYATGVARAKNLLGPWEKHPANPILRKSALWRCPGHGTTVEHEGRHFLLHHAYHESSHEYVGRQPMLSEYTYQDGWPAFLTGRPGAPFELSAAESELRDDFMGTELSQAWHWPALLEPRKQQQYGSFYLGGSYVGVGAMVAQRTLSGNYTAETRVPLQATAWAGLAAIGDSSNAIAIMTRKRIVQLVKVQNGVHSVLAQKALPARTTVLYLRLQVEEGHKYTLSFRPFDDTDFTPLQEEGKYVDGTYLPPWDRGVRIGLTSFGPETSEARFTEFYLKN